MSRLNFHKHWLHFPGDSVIYETTGGLDNKSCDIILTDKEIIFITQFYILKAKSKRLSLRIIDSVECRGFFIFWTVYLKYGFHSHKVKFSSQKEAEEFMNAVKKQLKIIASKSTY